MKWIRGIVFGGLVTGWSGLSAQTMVLEPEGIAVEPTPPVVSEGPMRMSVLFGDTRPGAFWLEQGERRFGPFRYREGARVGSQAGYTLLRPDSAKRFTLEAPDDRRQWGPFDYSDGAEVRLGEHTLTLRKMPSVVAGSWRHAAAVGPRPAIALAPYNQRMEQVLRGLRTHFAALAARYARDTADRIFEELPTIRGPHGVRRDRVVSRSRRDVENAQRAADASARVQLERLMRDHMPIRLTPRADGTFRSQGLAPGRYLLCGLVRTRPDEGSNLAPWDLAIWWTPLELGAHGELHFEFNAANAIRWDQIFL